MQCDVLYVDLPAPTNVRATVISHCKVEVTWDQLSDATEYIISYSTTASHISDGNVIVKGGSATCHIFTNLEEDTPYTITVQAISGDSRKSTLSNEVSIRTGKSNIVVQFRCKFTFTCELFMRNLHCIASTCYNAY